ncbi:MAG TPA: SurA N-terminal domain-containing protein [Dongiaceae bacterium]|nr:SurA N-terminal domain-containing protein [Dongiaceae bacterium]
MLSTIRGKAKSWIVKVLFGILILAFAAWGIGDIFSQRGLTDAVLTVGDRQYSQQEFNRDLQRELQRFRQQGLDLTTQQFAALGGVEQVLSRATNKLLLEQYADKLGLAVPQNVAIADIQNNPAFKGATGDFDRDRFLYVLRENGLSEAGYVAAVQEELRQQQLLGPTFAVVVAPKVLVDPVFAYQDEMRSAEVVTIPDSSITDIADPDQPTLEKFYQDHIANYQRPEYRSAVVLHLTPEEFAKGITVTDDQIKAAYEERKAEFETPETRAVEQVVVQEQAKADAIVAAVKGGKSFADAVKEATGGDPVDLGTVAKDAVPAAIADQTFALAADAVSEPITSPFGIHVVHVKAITPGNTKSLDEVKEQLRNELALAQAGDSLASVVNQLDDTLAGGASVEDAAAKLGLTAQKIEAVDADGKDREGKDLGLNAEILQLAQATEAGGTSLVSSLSDGSYAVVQVPSVAPGEAKPLTEVAEQVKSDWLAQARRAATDAKAKDMVEKLKTSGDLAALAKEQGLELKVTAPFARGKGDPDNGIDSTMASALFNVKLGEAATGRVADGAIVARLSAIEPAKAEDAKDRIDALTKQLASTLRNDLSAQFAAALSQDIKIERHNDVITQMLASEQ